MKSCGKSDLKHKRDYTTRLPLNNDFALKNTGPDAGTEILPFNIIDRFPSYRYTLVLSDFVVEFSASICQNRKQNISFCLT